MSNSSLYKILKIQNINVGFMIYQYNYNLVGIKEEN